MAEASPPSVSRTGDHGETQWTRRKDAVTSMLGQESMRLLRPLPGPQRSGRLWPLSLAAASAPSASASGGGAGATTGCAATGTDEAAAIVERLGALRGAIGESGRMGRAKLGQPWSPRQRQRAQQHHDRQATHPHPHHHEQHSSQSRPADPRRQASSSASSCGSGPSSGSGSGSAGSSGHSCSSLSLLPSQGHGGSRAPTGAMGPDEGPTLSFWGPDPVPLPARFARVKRKLIAGHEMELEQSWARLIAALQAEVEHIVDLGAHLIPSIEFGEIHDASQAARFGRDLRRYGVGVVRKVVARHDSEAMVRDTVQYLEARREDRQNGGGGGAGGAAANKDAYDVQPRLQDPTCYDFFWTPAQVRSRAHPGVLEAQRFMMSLWETAPDDRLATQRPVTYADRIRIHGNAGGTASSGGAAGPPGQLGIGLGPGSGSASGSHVSAPPTKPQTAEDWITSLQSSAGIIAQVDNGSLERWEPDGYQRSRTYDSIFHGRWEAYDPWQCASRVSATMDLYNGYGACTIFRMFQGIVALSPVEPGMVRLLPSPKLATSYYLLRPFFSPRTPAPECREGPLWDAYLHPSNWQLDRDPGSIIHGAVPGHAQRITEHWHPHLSLRRSMITLPTLQPGDYIFWHPDLPYHISSNTPGMGTPGLRSDEVSMLVYVPAAPLTQTNALYLARQRKAFQRGHPGPDFDSSGRGVPVEDPDVRPGEDVIGASGGTAALQAMGLSAWDTVEMSGTVGPNAGEIGSRHKRKACEGLSDDDKDDPPTSRLRIDSSPPVSSAEAEVIRLANIILFPERSMMGYSVS